MLAVEKLGTLEPQDAIEVVLEEQRGAELVHDATRALRTDRALEERTRHLTMERVEEPELRTISLLRAPAHERSGLDVARKKRRPDDEQPRSAAIELVVGDAHHSVEIAHSLEKLGDAVEALARFGQRAPASAELGRWPVVRSNDPVGASSRLGAGRGVGHG